jgi:hypothetical protein
MNKKFLAGSAVLLMTSCISSYYTEPYSLLGAEKTISA